MEGYVLWMGRSGCSGIRKRPSWVETGGLMAGWSGAGVRREPKWRLESLGCEGIWPDESKDLRACRSTVVGRGCV
jgi:hypothetical protein